MSRVFTLASLLCLLLFTSRSNAQCSQGVTQDFSASNGGFSSNFLTYQNQSFSERSNQDRTYVITSNDFTLSNQSSVTVRFGFVTEGAVTAVSVSMKDRNSTSTIVGTTSTTPGVYCTVFADVSGFQNRTVQFIMTITVSVNGQRTSTFDDFGSSLPEAAVTPVTFTSFDAKKLAAGTQLTWKVGVEENVSHYEIERSNGSSYVSVGSVPASGQSSYSFTDPQANSGTALYRIRSVDKDGQYKYSTIISLKNGVASVLFKAFPIPAGNTLTVQHPAVMENGKITIAGSDGRTVKSLLPAKGSMQTDIKLDGLNSGIYLLRFNRGNGELQTMKIIKQ